MKIGMIGHGNVGGAIANRLVLSGHQVFVGLREFTNEQKEKVVTLNSQLKPVPPQELRDLAPLFFLSTPFSAAKEALSAAALSSGSVVVDCTNPVGAGLTHSLKSEISGAESLQKEFPQLKFVKAYSIYGFENFADNRTSQSGNQQPAMLIAGNDPEAKMLVSELLKEQKWQPIDTGPLSMALHLEHLALLWIKMARMQGRDPHFMWGLVEGFRAQ